MANEIYSFRSTTPANQLVYYKGTRAANKSLYVGSTTAEAQSVFDTLYSGTNLQGKITALGNGWQKFVVPKSGKITATVRGGSGGLSTTTAGTINAVTGATSGLSGGKPGRGAKLVGQFSAKKGDVLYILVGFHGTDKDGSGSWGASGGGASAILRVNPSANHVFQPTNEKVEVLMVAGGGGGSTCKVFDNQANATMDGIDAVTANGNNSSGGVLAATTDTGKTNYGGAGAGLGGDGLGNSSNTGAKPYALLKGVANMTGSQVPATWGGGAPPQAGAGGGGGFSGGNSRGRAGGYGGTSYIHPTLVTAIFRGYATVAEDKDRDCVNPWMSYGHIELSVKVNDKYLLIQDGDTIKYFNGSNSFEGEANPEGTNSWEPLPDDLDLGVDTFKEYGRFSITGVDGIVNSNIKFLTMCKEEESNLVINGLINHSVVEQVVDVNLADVSLIKSFEYIANTNIAETKFAFSKNSGKTWQTYNGIEFVDIDIKDKETFAADGYSLSLISSVPLELWGDYNPKYIRFAFCITQKQQSTATVINLIKILTDLTGSWRKAKEAEASYEYTATDNLKVHFYSTGNYKVNYLDNLTAESV